MLYLAYGSNLHPQRLRQRVPSAKLLGKTVVPDRVLRFHKRSVVDGSAKCNMTRSAGTVHAAIYRIAADDKPALDRVEGLGVGYQIETLNVAGYGDCYTYIAMDTHIDESLKPFTWYKELVIVGCERLQFPADYLTAIATVESIDDPDLQRHASNMHIVQTARQSHVGQMTRDTGRH